MTEPLAYLNGEFLPFSAMSVSVFDSGFTMGATVTEMIRTFDRKPFRLADHLDRLQASLDAVKFPHPPARDDLHAAVTRLVEHNAVLIPAGHDLGINIFVTPGWKTAYLSPQERAAAPKSTVGIHTWPLAFELWSERYETGQHLVVPSIRQIPAECIDPRIKMRSRLHWYLADQQAAARFPGAQALPVDENGFVTETSTANFCVCFGRTVKTPQATTTLGGISLQVVEQLVTDLGYTFKRADLAPDDIAQADEAFTTSTPYCLLPVTQFAGRPLGTGEPGPIYRQLIEAWNTLVGVDIIAQSRRTAHERLNTDNI